MEARKIVPAVALGALLVVDAGLIAWALRPPPPVGSYLEKSASADPSGSASAPAASPSPSASASPDTGAAASVPVTQMVVAVDASVAWVATSGTCKSPGAVWVTSDSGATWTKPAAAPGRVMRMRPSSSKVAFVTGGDKNCATTLWSTDSAGSSWASPGDASQAWTRVAADETKVQGSNGKEVQPCPEKATVLDLAPLDGKYAAVLCVDGAVLTTADSGTTWKSDFTEKGAMALSMLDPSTGAVVVTAKGCDGVQVTPVRSGKPASGGTCVPSTPSPGEVSISGTAKGWWLVVGQDVFTASTDEGPWKAAKGSLGG